jgi:hypothetical protein
MAQRSQPDIDLRRFWLGIALPAVVWALHLTIVYSAQSTACHWGFLQGTILGVGALRLLLLALSLLAGGVVFWGGWTLNRVHRDLVSRSSVEREDPSGRVRFMARAGTWLAGLFLFSIFLTLFPILLLDQCAPFWW